MEETRNTKAKRTAPRSLSAKLVERVLQNLEVGQLADTIAAKLSEQILGSLKVDSIVNTLMEIWHRSGRGNNNCNR